MIGLRRKGEMNSALICALAGRLVDPRDTPVKRVGFHNRVFSQGVESPQRLTPSRRLLVHQRTIQPGSG